MGRANEKAVLTVLVHAGGAGLAPAQLAEQAGLPASTLRAAVARLEGRHLVGREGKRRIFATAAGRAEAASHLPGTSLEGGIEASINLLPSEALRAWVRLVLSAAIARHHLRSIRPYGWPSGIAVGPTKTGKSTAALVVIHALGLDPAGAIRPVSGETERSLLGRREQLPGGRWRLIPAEPLTLPALVLEEWDHNKTDTAVRRAVLKLAQGDARVAGEGLDTFDVVPTAVLLANGSPAQVPEEYRRRAFVVDTTPLRPLLVDTIGPAARALARTGAVPALPLGTLRPPCERLPDGILDEAMSYLRDGLTDRGWELADAQSIEAAALGRAALAGVDLRQAVLASVADYLTTAATVGEAAPGRMPAALLDALGGRLAPDPTEAQAEAADVQQRRTQRDQEERRETHQLTAARAALAQRLEDAGRRIRSGVPEDLRDIAAGVRAWLSALRREALDSRSREALEHVAEEAEEPLAHAQRILTERAARKEQMRLPLPGKPLTVSTGSERSPVDTLLSLGLVKPDAPPGVGYRATDPSFRGGLVVFPNDGWDDPGVAAVMQRYRSDGTPASNS